MHGFASVYRWTKKPKFLATKVKEEDLLLPKIQADGPRTGLASSSPARASKSQDGLMIFDSDGGTSGVRHCSSGVRVRVGLQAIPEGDLGRCETAGNGGGGMSFFHYFNSAHICPEVLSNK